MFNFLKSTSDSQSQAEAIAAFALDLYSRLRQDTGGNIFFSPFSLSAALAMTWAGARGETAHQMAQVLHFKLPGDRQHAAYTALLRTLADVQAQGKVALHAANALWPQTGYP